MFAVPKQLHVFVFAVALIGVPPIAQEKQITSGVESDFNSKFVWREEILDERPVTKTSVWLDTHGVDVTLWANGALSSATDQSRLRSSGLWVSYVRDWKKLTIEPAIEVYRWQDDPGFTDTMECSVRFEYQTGFVRIFSEHALDVIANKGGYFGEAGLRFEKKAGKRTEAAIELASGYASRKFNDYNIDVAKPAMNFLSAEIAVTHDFNPHFYVRPHLNFIHLPDPQIREELGVRNLSTLGVAVGFKF